MQSLFDVKIKQFLPFSSFPSSLNLLVSKSDAFPKPLQKDNVVLKKWLHDWVYIIDKRYRFNMISLSKEQHLEFDELFDGKKLNYI